MTKFEKLMPVSHIVRAFCKAMKSLIEDEVVVNDMECQLNAEMVRVSEEIPILIYMYAASYRKHYMWRRINKLICP